MQPEFRHRVANFPVNFHAITLLAIFVLLQVPGTFQDAIMRTENFGSVHLKGRYTKTLSDIYAPGWQAYVKAESPPEIPDANVPGTAQVPTNPVAGTIDAAGTGAAGAAGVAGQGATDVVSGAPGAVGSGGAAGEEATDGGTDTGTVAVGGAPSHG